MLFGLGAIGLSQEPRGVVYDIVNRQRLRSSRMPNGARKRRGCGPSVAVEAAVTP